MSNRKKGLFKKKMNGYDPNTVDAYIRDLQNKLNVAEIDKDTLKTNLDNAKKKNEDLLLELNELKESIETREKAVDEMSRIALKEANLIVETANKNADLIVKESLATARQILIEMSNLGNEAIFLKKSVKSKMENLAKVIDEFTLPNIPSLDCLDLVDENDDEDKI